MKDLIPPEPADRLGRQLREAIEHVLEAFRKMGALPTEVPEDPRERALHLRQNRNTGPTKPRMDGRKR